jgi:glyoxylase-like metal-dependent hydrolase (beta-lactamase superfamily II)
LRGAPVPSKIRSPPNPEKFMLPGNISFAAALPVIAIVAVLAGCSKKEETPPPAAQPAEAAPVTESAAAAPASAHTFKVGDLTAMALRDGALEMPNDNQVFGVGRTPEEVAAVLAANNLPTDKLALTIQPLLVKTTDRVLLFDTGAGGNFGPGSGALLASFANAGVDPSAVTDVFISHGHGDHVGGLVNEQGALNFPNATIHLSKAEWEFLSGVKEEQAKNMGLGQLGRMLAAMKPKVAAFAPGAELIPGVVKAVDIQGHTPGHSGYLVTSGAESLLYVGDSMHHHVVSVQKPEWTIAFDHDSPTASKSRADLIAQSAANGQRVYAVHFPFPGIGRFEKRGEGFAWVGE